MRYEIRSFSFALLLRWLGFSPNEESPIEISINGESDSHKRGHDDIVTDVVMDRNEHLRIPWLKGDLENRCMEEITIIGAEHRE